MLNPRWYENEYDKDMRSWRALEASGTMFLEPQVKKLNYLLDKYFVTKSGYKLGPGYSNYQKLEILRKTMESLEYAILHYEQQKADEWHAQRDKEEDPNAKSLREEEMEKIRREGSIRIISKLDVDRLHGGKGDGRPDSDFDSKKLKEGADHEMEHTDEKDIAKEIAKDHLTEDPDYYEKVKKIESSNIPNPLRQNYDYSNELNGPEWKNRVKKYRDLIHKEKEAQHVERKRY